MFGAKKTPEAYLLKPNGQKFSVVYKGAIDDNPQNPSDIGEAFLKNAIEIVIKGESINHMKSRPVGCMIKS